MTQHRLSVWASSKWTISTFYCCFCVETETPCSLVVSASKKSGNSEGQMQNTRRFFYTPVIACHYINLFLSSQKNFCKKGIIVVIGNATQHEGEVREISVISCVEKYVFFSMSEVSLSSTLVIGVLNEVKVKRNLLRHIDKHHLVSRKFFLRCKKSRSIFFDKAGYILCLYEIASR